MAEYPDQQFAQTLKQLIERLPLYEKEMQAKTMSTQMTPQQRYQEIWNLREQTLGKQETQLGFAEEKEFASYQFAYGEALEPRTAHDLTTTTERTFTTTATI